MGVAGLWLQSATSGASVGVESLMDVRPKVLSSSDLCPVTLAESQMPLTPGILVSLSHKDIGVTKGTRRHKCCHVKNFQ